MLMTGPWRLGKERLEEEVRLEAVRLMVVGEGRGARASVVRAGLQVAAGVGGKAVRLSLERDLVLAMVLVPGDGGGSGPSLGSWSVAVVQSLGL